MVHVADNKYDFDKINILEYAFGEGVIKKRTLCTLSQTSTIVNDPLSSAIGPTNGFKTNHL